MIVQAATLTDTLFNYDSKDNVAVTIYYDSEKPIISFIAPDGTTYSESNLEVVTGDKVIAYYIPDAMAGEWKIVYDKLSNQTLDVNCAPYANPIKITKFETSKITNKSAELSFDVSSDYDDVYHYKVFATALDSNGNVSGARELQNGTGNLNQTANIIVRLDSLQSYDQYYFYLDVWHERYDIESNDTMLSQNSFSIDNPNSPVALRQEMVNTEIDMTNLLLTVNWDASNITCDEYVLVVYDDKNHDEPIYANSFENNLSHETTISLPSGTDKVRIELSYVKKGVTSNPFVREILIKTGINIDFPEEDVVSTSQIYVKYSSDKKIDANVSVRRLDDETNSPRSENIMLDKSGSFSVILEDFENEIIISYVLDNYNKYYFSKRISFNSSAPLLLLPEHDVTIFWENETFDIVGATSPDCIVTIDDVEIPLNEDGTFIQTVSLVDGENEFIVNSKNLVGNISSQAVVIHKLVAGQTVASIGDHKMLKYLPILYSFISSIALIIILLIFTRLYKKRKSVSKAYAIVSYIRDVLILFTIVSIGITVFLFIKHLSLNTLVTTDKLSQIVQNSISEAYHLIKQHKTYRKLLNISIITSLVGVALSVITLFVAKKLRFQPKKTKVSKKKEKISKYTCPNCGEEHEDPVKFCGKCGTPMNL